MMSVTFKKKYIYLEIMVLRQQDMTLNSIETCRTLNLSSQTGQTIYFFASLTFFFWKSDLFL